MTKYLTMWIWLLVLQCLVLHLAIVDSVVTCPNPPNLPSSIPIKATNFANWAGDVTADGVWTASPTNEGHIVTLANWAFGQGWKLRGVGAMGSWSPAVVDQGGPNCPSTLLLDLTANMNAISPVVVQGSMASVTLQPGATMDQLTQSLKSQGYGFYAVPAAGFVTVGGVLAIGSRGTGMGPVPPGKVGGTLSNAILSFKAVVWNSTAGAYEIQSFSRSAGLLVSFGRIVMTEVTLQVGSDVNMRVQSFTNVPANQLYGSAGSKTYASYLSKYNAMSTIWFPFTDAPWLLLFSIVTTPPPITSLHVSKAYNYPFIANLPVQVSTLVNQIVAGNPSATPAFGLASITAIQAGLVGTLSSDIWGASGDILIYVEKSALRVSLSTWGVLTTRARVQEVIHGVVSFYNQTLYSYAANGMWPMNGPLEIRTTLLDVSANPPLLSELAPYADFDTAVWFDLSSLPQQTPGNAQFRVDIESYLLSNFNDGTNYIVRPEWSKAWGYSGTDGAWKNGTVMNGIIPQNFNDWNTGIQALTSADPNNVLTNTFLQGFLQNCPACVG